MAVVQTNLVDIARGLEQKVKNVPLDHLDDTDSQNLQTILGRFLELEKRRQSAVKSQVAYQQRIARDNPDKVRQKRLNDVCKAAVKYQNDSAFRERILENKRLRYARQKESS